MIAEDVVQMRGGWQYHLWQCHLGIYPGDDSDLDLGSIGGMDPRNLPLWLRKINLDDSSISQECPGVQIDLGKCAEPLAPLAQNLDTLSNVPSPVLHATVIGTFDYLPVGLGEIVCSV